MVAVSGALAIPALAGGQKPSGSSNDGHATGGHPGNGHGNDNGHGSNGHGNGNAPKGSGTTTSSTTTPPPTTTATAPTPTPKPTGSTTTTTATPTTTGATTTGSTTTTTSPSLGHNVVVAPSSGTVLVQTPGRPAAPLTASTSLPNGSIVDATHGQITLTAKRTATTVNSATFWGARFQVQHPHGDPGLTELTLREKPVCPAPGTTTHEAATRKPPKLWGHDHHGRFETRGRNAVATVRGTVWYMAETCHGTVVGVISGSVAVRNRWTGKVSIVRGTS